MGFFDRWKKQAAPPTPAAGSAPDTVVPDGHHVSTYKARPVPGVGVSQSGVWLAHVGHSSDEQETELAAALDALRSLLGGRRPKVLLANVRGTLSSLFAPANPELRQLDGMLVWIVAAEALGESAQAPVLVQRLLRCMYRVGSGDTPLSQNVFVHGVASARGRAVAEMIGSVGIGVRLPEASDGTLLVDVHRPEGVVLGALVGAAYRQASPSDTWARDLNQAKDEAEGKGDTASLERLEREEQEEIRRRLVVTEEEPRIASVARAPRLDRLMLAVVDGGDGQRPALYEELLQREIPLLVIVDPETQAAALRRWPGGKEGMAVYASRGALLASAADLGLAPGSFAIAEMPPPKLFTWAASQGWMLALNVFRKRDEPLYVPLAPGVVAALSRGEMPSSKA